MLSRISDRANLTDSEGINGFALAGWPYMGFQSGTVRNIDAHGEQALDAVNNADILKHIHPNVRRNLNHDIDVAVGGRLAAPAPIQRSSTRSSVCPPSWLSPSPRGWRATRFHTH